jgi:hypothetical protein
MENAPIVVVPATVRTHLLCEKSPKDLKQRIASNALLHASVSDISMSRLREYRLSVRKELLSNPIRGIHVVRIFERNNPHKCLKI